MFLKEANDTILVSLNGLMCTEEQIEAAVTSFDNKRFIFLGFSHGDNNCLETVNDVFVSSNNSSLFSNSLFYTCSCLSGIDLGPELIAKNCSTYIGYNTSFIVIEDYSKYFIECKTSGIKKFLRSDLTIKQSFDFMLKKYQDVIDNLVKGTADEFIAASNLRKNMKGLIFLGNEDLIVKDFFAA